MRNLIEIDTKHFYSRSSAKLYVQSVVPSPLYKVILGGAGFKVNTRANSVQRKDLRSRIGAGKLRSYLDPAIISFIHPSSRQSVYAPPGAVGGRYGSGCFHFSKSASVSLIKAYKHFSDMSGWFVCRIVVHVVSVARQHSCSLRKDHGCKEPVLAKDNGGQSSQEQASMTVGKGCCATVSVSCLDIEVSVSMG